MRSEDHYFQNLTEDQVWQRYCGFLDLSITEFMDVQRELLLDQIDRVADSKLGKQIMGDRKPTSVDDFRKVVPITTYEDYEPYLSERQEDALAIKPYAWCHSSGRGGRYKWIPHGEEFLDRAIRCVLGTVILSATKQRGKVNVTPGIKALMLLAPPPYVSGTLFQVCLEKFTINDIMQSDKVRGKDFMERASSGFQVAFKEGVELIGALASVLAKMGEGFSEQTRSTKFSLALLHPKIIYTLVRAIFRAKREGRVILPKDLWPSKAIMTGGVDTAIYRDEIIRYWGSAPHEFYACAEGFFLATQTWNRKGMVFPPNLVFLEFVPVAGQAEPYAKEDLPATVLLDELEEGKSYEVIITQLYGMPLLRYRMKDVITVIGLRDEETGINLPHIVFQRRVDEVINIAALAQLDEKTIWETIAATGIKYVDWAACKEYDQGQSYLRLYIELKEDIPAAELETMIDKQLKVTDTDYQDIETYLNQQPVRVTLLQRGTFERYMEAKKQEGADLAHLKPAHINPTGEVIQRLLDFSEAK